MGKEKERSNIFLQTPARPMPKPHSRTTEQGLVLNREELHELRFRKSVTIQRPWKPQPEKSLFPILRRYPNQKSCPFGSPGSILWVREAYWITPEGETRYLADSDFVVDGSLMIQARAGRATRSPTCMPRSLARTFVEISELHTEVLDERALWVLHLREVPEPNLPQTETESSLV